MQTIRVDIRLRAPLQHGAFSMEPVGNIIPLRRTPMVMADGQIRQIPCISGNSLRGRIRRALMRGLLEAMEIRDTLCDAGEEIAYQHLYAALVNGGHLRDAIKRVDPKATRDLREALPPLSVMGSALFDRLMAGRCDVRMVWPVCEETVALGLVEAPEAYQVSPAEDLVTEHSHCRHPDHDEHSSEVTGVTAMPVTYEVLATGTRMQADVIVRGSDLEASAIAWALDRIASIGGGAAKGLGEIDVMHDGSGDAYADWLATRRERIRSDLLDLARSLVPQKKGKKTKKTEPASGSLF